MASLKKAANAIKASPWIIPITFVFITLFIVAILLMFEDYSTSLAGYTLLPTRKANEWIPYVVALIPQLCQVGLIYIFVDNTDKKWALFFAFLFYLVDISTDMYFKANGMDWTVWLTAFFESNIIYTFGSEWLFTLAGGMIVQLFPDFTKQLGDVAEKVMRGSGVLNDEDTPRRGRPKNTEMVGYHRDE